MRSIFEISTRGLLSARTAAETVSNNIANAQTPGFSRRRAVLTEEVQRLQSGVFGKGVSVSEIQRLRDGLIDQQIIRNEHQLGDFSEKANLFRLMETALISVDGAGLDASMRKFFDSFSDLSTNPQDINLRNILISDAVSLTETFRSLDSNLDEFSDQALQTANGKLERVNTLLQDLAALNGEIANSSADNNPNNNAFDRQTEKLKELAGLVEFNSLVSDQGTIEIRIGGVSVLNGRQVSAMKAEIDEENNIYRVRMDGGKVIEPGKGELAANIFMFSEGVPDLREQLDNIAETFIDSVNSIHSTGYGLNDNVLRNFFDPTSSSAGNMRIEQQLINDPSNIAASSMVGEAGNNDIALAISSLQNEKVLGNQTFNTNAVQFMSTPGLRLSELNQKIDSATASKEFLTVRQEQTAGVSIDEELGDLIRFQNAFQASARVLDTGRQMFDTLLSIA